MSTAEQLRATVGDVLIANTRITNYGLAENYEELGIFQYEVMETYYQVSGALDMVRTQGIAIGESGKVQGRQVSIPKNADVWSGIIERR